MYDSNLDPDFNFDLPPNQPPAQWVNGQAVTAPLANKDLTKNRGFDREYDTSRINQVTGKMHFYKTVNLGFVSYEKEVFPFGNPQDSPKSSPPPSPPSSPVMPQVGFKRVKQGSPDDTQINDPRLEELNYGRYGIWKYDDIPEDVFPEDVDEGSTAHRKKWIKQFERTGAELRANDVKNSMKKEFEKVIGEANLTDKLDIWISPNSYNGMSGSSFTMQLYDISSNGRRNKCFDIRYSTEDNSLTVDSLKYPNQKDCNVSGPDLLKLLRKAVEKVTNKPPTFMIGSDASQIEMEMLDKAGSRVVDLARLTLLKKGLSWYNDYGFVGDTFDQEKARNDTIRNEPLDQRFAPDLISDFKVSFDLDDMPSNISIKDFMNLVEKKRKMQGGKYTSDQLDNLERMMNKINFYYPGYRLTYNRNLDRSRVKNKK